MEGVEKALTVNTAAAENSTDLKEGDVKNTVSSEYDSIKEDEYKNQESDLTSNDTEIKPEAFLVEEEQNERQDEKPLKESAVEEEQNAKEEEKPHKLSAVEEEQNAKQEEKPHKFFVIQEYNAKKGNDYTNGEQPLIRNSTIEELKLKLENKDILVRQRPNTPTSPLTPTSPTKQDPLGDDSEDMIPETRAPSLLSDDGLIAPRKPVNPVREDPGRKNLHRELLFNQKIGKNVLNQKSELQRALERHKDNVAKKQLENHSAAKTPELEKVIADRARRLENPVKKEENEDDKVINKEFLQARMKLKSTNEIK